MTTKKFITFILAASFMTSGAAFAQNVNNGGMENWTPYSVQTGLSTNIDLNIPNGWHGSDSVIAGYAIYASLMNITLTPSQQIFKTSDAHSGQFAAQLFSKSVGDSVGVQPAALSNAAFNIDLNSVISNSSNLISNMGFKGGEPISGNVATVSAWVKVGDSSAVDSFSIQVLTQKAINNDSNIVIGQGTIKIEPSLTTYTKVTIPVQSILPGQTPDHLVVIFSSGSPNGTDNNSMKVDDVTYTMSTGIKIPLMTEDAALVYPIPTTDKVYFNLKSTEQAKDFNLQITDLEGRIIYNKALKAQINPMDMSSWARGVYFYQLINKTTNQAQRGKLILR